jgi:ATP-binding cassette subfamily B protein
MSFFSNLGDEGYDRQYSDIELTRRILAYFKPHLRKVAVVAGLLAVIALTGAALPVLVARGIDLLGEDVSSLEIFLLCGAVLLTGLITWGASWLQRRLTSEVVGDIVLSLRSDAFEAAISHDLSFFDKYASGRIVSRITSDTQDFAQVVVILTDVFSQVVQTILLTVILIRIDWRLFMIILLLMPLVFLVAVGFRKLARRVTRRGMRAMGNVNAAIKETVSGISVAKNFRQEWTIYNEFDQANQQSFRVNVQRGFVLSLVFPVLNALNGLGWAILVYAGGLSVVAGIVSAGAWYLFMLSLDRFWFPVLNLTAFWAQIQSGLSAAERIFALIDAESAVKQTDTLHPGRLRGEICIEDLEFSYVSESKGSLQVFRDFSLRISPGETLALVGHTGAGKSSIAKLVARFYEFQGGQIEVDGMDIRTLDLRDYRRQLGIVSQVPFLFAGTVSENIRYACPEASEEEIRALAFRIGDGEWLETLPDGLDTQVGERGSLLSMGQRQLVSLLRVLVQRPAIFILDEATASIDPFTEWQIQQALYMVLSNTTSILIAHRLSTVKAADRIVVLREGKIIEEGNHDGLMAGGGHYAELYNTYFRHQSLDYRPDGIDEILEERKAFQGQLGRGIRKQE